MPAFPLALALSPFLQLLSSHLKKENHFLAYSSLPPPPPFSVTYLQLPGYISLLLFFHLPLTLPYPLSIVPLLEHPSYQSRQHPLPLLHLPGAPQAGVAALDPTPYFFPSISPLRVNANQKGKKTSSSLVQKGKEIPLYFRAFSIENVSLNFFLYL